MIGAGLTKKVKKMGREGQRFYSSDADHFADLRVVGIGGWEVVADHTLEEDECLEARLAHNGEIFGQSCAGFAMNRKTAMEVRKASWVRTCHRQYEHKTEDL